MAGKLGAVIDGLAVSRDALELFDEAVASVAADVALGSRFPTVEEIADSAETILRESVAAINDALDKLGMDATVPLTVTALDHLAYVRTTARTMIREAQARGVSARQLRNDLAELLRGNDIDAGRYGMTRSDLTPIRTLRFDGERLLTDQLFEATRSFALDNLKRRGEKRARWVLSGRHKEVDVCDDLAKRGPYRLSKFPPRPHPFCGCMPGLVRDA